MKLLHLREAGIYSASILWSSVNATLRGFRRFNFINSFCRPFRLDARVMSVGNIQAGGAGKTPLTALIAKQAHERGLKVCILSRGYKGAWESSGGTILPVDESETGLVKEVDPNLCGDEPALLHQLCPFAFIGVGSNRIKQYQALLNLTQQKMDLVLLDDGFQHWSIEKNLEILAWTSSKPWEKVFRDFQKLARSVDLVVWTKGNDAPKGIEHLVQVQYHLDPAPYSDPIWLVTGVADGESVSRLALQFGYNVVKVTANQDHYRYSKSVIQGILKEASELRMRVAITGKDWVKWKALGVLKSDVLVLEPKIEFLRGKEIWNRILWGE